MTVDLAAAKQMAEMSLAEKRLTTAGPWIVGGIAHSNNIVSQQMPPDPDVGSLGLWPVLPANAYPHDIAHEHEREWQQVMLELVAEHAELKRQFSQAEIRMRIAEEYGAWAKEMLERSV